MPFLCIKKSSELLWPNNVKNRGENKENVCHQQTSFCDCEELNSVNSFKKEQNQVEKEYLSDSYTRICQIAHFESKSGPRFSLTQMVARYRYFE